MSPRLGSAAAQDSQGPVLPDRSLFGISKDSSQPWLRLGICAPNVQAFKFLIRISYCNWYVRKLTPAASLLTADSRGLAFTSSIQERFVRCFSFTPTFLPLESVLIVS